MVTNFALKRIVSKKIAELKPHPKQYEFNRQPTDQEIADIAASLDRDGLINPVEILSDGTIICGHSRVAGGKSLGWTEIACWVRKDLESQGEDAVERRLLEDNVNRKQNDPLRMARAYKRLKQLDGSRPEQVRGDLRDILAKQFGVAGRTLDRWVELLDAPLVIQEAVITKQLRRELGCKVAGFSAQIQQEVVARISDGEAPRAVVAEYVEEQKLNRAKVYETLARFIGAFKLCERLVAHQLEDVHAERWTHELPTLQRAGEFIVILHDHIAKGDAPSDEE